MKIISLSQRKFKDLTKLDLPKEVFNTEAIIYNFRYKGKDKIFKKLYNASGSSFASKLYTIEMLSSNKEYLPDNFCIPTELLSVGGVIEGPVMPKIDGENLSVILKNKKLDTKMQIFYLKLIGELLNKLKYVRSNAALSNFYLNDLQDSNFLVNLEQKKLYVVDLDSAKVSQNTVCPSRFLNENALLNNALGKYKLSENEDEFGYINADENTDLYCYMIIILNYLYGENINNVDIVKFYDYLNYLEHIGVDKELVSAFSKILTYKNNENPVEILSSLTNEQVYRAKRKVYEMTSK